MNELQKPGGRWCDHVRNETSHGCRIYADPARPGVCAAFECLWLQGCLPNEARPDRINAVFGATEHGEMVLVWANPDPPYTDLLTGGPVRALIQTFVEAGKPVYAMRGAERTVFARSHENLPAVVRHHMDRTLRSKR